MVSTHRQGSRTTLWDGYIYAYISMGTKKINKLNIRQLNYKMRKSIHPQTDVEILLVCKSVRLYYMGDVA